MQSQSRRLLRLCMISPPGRRYWWWRTGFQPSKTPPMSWLSIRAAWSSAVLRPGLRRSLACLPNITGCRERLSSRKLRAKIVRYQMLDVELTAPAPTAALNEAAGLGLILRLDRVVQAFAMGAIKPGETAAGLLDRLVVETSETLLSAAVRRQLAPALQPLTRRSLTVVICTRDRPDLLKRCLDAVVAVRPSWAEIVVVDNASKTAATRDVVAACGDVRHVFEGRPGLDFARNRALAEATSDWIAYIDDDVVVDRGYFDGVAAAWAGHPDATAVTGLVLPLELETEAQIIFERNGGFGRGFIPRRYGFALTE